MVLLRKFTITSSKWFAADFETTSLKNLETDGRVRVWLWSLVGVENGETASGTTIKEFFDIIKRYKIRKIFFHNLKFDGKFIVDYLFSIGCEYNKDFTTIIDGLGAWYEIKYNYRKDVSVVFWDSLKKFPGTSVKNLGKLVGENKLEPPYFDKYYPENYMPSEHEVDYCITDSRVVSLALRIALQQDFRKMTMAGDCFKFGKDLCLGGRNYRDYFPVISKDMHDFCSKAYRGGLSYLKPEYEDVEIENVKVFDVNSLYPSVMYYSPLPVGNGIFTDEEPTDKLYFVNFDAEFLVKKYHFPFIQLKNNLSFTQNEFVTDSKGVQNLTLTSVDYKNFKNNYHVINEKINKYCYFKSEIGIMKPHIDYWMKRKKEYEQQGLPFMRYIAKTMMNGFYGKTATRTNRLSVVPHYDEENKVSYSDKILTEVEPIYLPYGAFVTAWARDKLINSSLKMWDKFIYCDTDSIHCFESDSYDLDIHQSDLGKWKDETIDGAYEYARYIKQKTYCHARPGIDANGNPIKEVVEIRAAGLNNDARSGIKIEDFKYGLVINEGNRKMKTVPGGCVLVPSIWELKDDKDAKLREKIGEDYDRFKS